jgi:hypothetical protein
VDPDKELVKAAKLKAKPPYSKITIKKILEAMKIVNSLTFYMYTDRIRTRLKGWIQIRKNACG